MKVMFRTWNIVWSCIM